MHTSRDQVARRPAATSTPWINYFLHQLTKETEPEKRLRWEDKLHGPFTALLSEIFAPQNFYMVVPQMRLIMAAGATSARVGLVFLAFHFHTYHVLLPTILRCCLRARTTTQITMATYLSTFSVMKFRDVAVAL